MLVEYRMLSTISASDFLADVVGILDGSITSTAGLSAGADVANCSFSGTYPSSKLTKVNAGSYTFAKVHGEDASYTHYFRLAFSGTTLTTFTVAQSYTAGTDTLVNSEAQTVNIVANPYSSVEQFPSGINFVMNNKCVYMSSPTSGASIGLFDLGTNGITSTFADNMKMAFIKTNDFTYRMPYAYNLDGSVSGYVSMNGNLESITSPVFKSNANEDGVIVENPVFISNVNQGYAAYGVYGLFKIADNLLRSDGTYTIGGGVTRLVSNNYAIPAEG